MQFIALSYNHEKYIIEHLESIKFQVERFASEPCSVLVVDDCSRDRTIEKASAWIKRNGNLFRKAEIVASPKNAGISKNFIKAISLIEEDRFKILAGDDLYAMNSVFDVINKFDLFVTPVIPFSEDRVSKCSAKRGISTYYQYKAEPISIETARMNLSKWRLFSTPGVFLSRRLVEDDDLQEYILQYRQIEDLPMWHYLFEVKREQMTIDKTAVPYVMYRVGTGISTSPKHEAASQFRVEEERIRRIACPDFYRPLKREKDRWERRIRKAVYLPAYVLGIGDIGNYKNEYESQWAKADTYLELIRMYASDFENGISYQN